MAHILLLIFALTLAARPATAASEPTPHNPIAAALAIPKDELHAPYHKLTIITGDAQEQQDATKQQPASYIVYASTLNNSQPTYHVRTDGCEDSDCVPQIPKALMDTMMALFDEPDSAASSPVEGPQRDALSAVDKGTGQASDTSYANATVEADASILYIRARVGGNSSSAAAGTAPGPDSPTNPSAETASNGLGHSNAGAKRMPQPPQSDIPLSGIVGYVVAGINSGSPQQQQGTTQLTFLSDDKAASSVACAAQAQGASAEARSAGVYTFWNNTAVRDRAEVQSFAYTVCSSGAQEGDSGSPDENVTASELSTSGSVATHSKTWAEAHCNGVRNMDVDHRLHYKFVVSGTYLRGDGFQGMIHGQKFEMSRAHCL